MPDGVRIDSSPRASGVLDTMCTCKGNGIALPPALSSESNRMAVEEAVVYEWFGGFLENRTYQRLGIGRLLGDLLQRIDKSKPNTVNDSKREKIALYGAHDTSIGALLSTLDCFDGRWPGYSAHVALELFEDQKHGRKLLGSSDDGWYVRFRYNGDVVTPAVCKLDGNHHSREPSLCSLKAFRDAIDQVTPADWKEDCRG